jgi:putative ABC transport system permease protein
MKSKLEDALNIKVVGIIKPNEESNITTASYGEIGYLHDLTEYVINEINNSEIVKEQLDNKDINVFTGNKFSSSSNTTISASTLTDEQKMQLSQMTEEEQLAYMSAYAQNSESTYEDNLELLGVVDLDNPSGINIYPSSFDAKDEIKKAIDDYNNKQTENGNEENTIEYTDLVGTMMTSVTRIVNIISYVLIAFVAISLVVSSIMIAIITYISVLERTKEIGILRAMGTSKNDISKIFNAETFIEGLMSGVLGIVITLLIDIPINLIIYNALGVSNIAALPVNGAVALIIISVVLNVIAGLIPAKIASKKDPAVVLRSE